jgi:hypothetical protein
LRWLAVLVVTASGSPARADQETVELRYSAPPGCPSRAAFEAEILERTPNVRLAAPARRVFAVTIEPADDGFRGTLVVDRKGADPLTAGGAGRAPPPRLASLVDQAADKQLASPRCEDLTSALALVTALAIDPTATVTPRTRTSAPPMAAAPRRRAWSLELDLAAMVEAGAAPGALLAGAIAARASWRDGYAIELAAIAGRDTVALDDAEARFTWLAARPAACRSSPAREITVDVCGHAEIGAVRADGGMIINQRDLTRLWLAAGLHASARVAVGSRGFGLLQLGASLPLVRDRYIFAPNVEVHETPSVTGWLVVGVGMRFL